MNSDTMNTEPNDWPEEVSRGLWSMLRSKFFYSYMNVILGKGASIHIERAKQKSKNSASIDKAQPTELTSHDLYSRPQTMSASNLRARFWELREEQQREETEWLKSSGTVKPRNKNPRELRRSFLTILWRLAKPTYIPAGICQFLYVCLQCTVPQLIRILLTKLESNPNTNFPQFGLPIACALFASSIVEGISAERQKFLSFQTGIVLKSAVVNAVYDHVLGLTACGSRNLNSAEITTLVAIDAQKLFELTQEGHQIWACPLALIIVTCLLLYELGPVILVGIASMILLLPVVTMIVSRMMHYRKRRIGETDKRVEIVTSMLQSMKFTKLNHYESKFGERIQSHRRLEVSLLRHELFYLGIVFFVTVMSPVLACGVTFAVYVLKDGGDNTLSASTIFTTVYLFGVLRFPINQGGKLMGKAAQGLQACQRFANFFARESVLQPLLEDSETTRALVSKEENGDDVVLSVTNAKFSIASTLEVDADAATKDEDKDTEQLDVTSSSVSNSNAFTVSGVTLSVRTSEICCIVGPVASGKSTLCRGLIGTLTRESGMVQTRGSMAYASQTPFILNATLRDNILFGNPYNPELYQSVLDACCLLPDLDGLGNGDLTEIGERGVTLSGGQKQRLSLARVAYAQPRLAILDDPLSALDAGTSARVFEKLFVSPSSPLKVCGTAIVLVTNAGYLLHRVDRILVLVGGRPVFCGDWNSLKKFRVEGDGAEVEEARLTIGSLQGTVQEGEVEDDVDVDLSAASDIVTATPQTSITDKLTEPTKTKTSTNTNTNKNDLMTVEEREFGLSDWRTWLKWFRYAGGIWFVAGTIIMLTIDRGMYVMTEWWLAAWSDAESTSIVKFDHQFPPQTDGYTSHYQFLTVYGIIFSISIVATFLRSQWIVQAGPRCSQALFHQMMERVQHAPMHYFETTPLGRILNRFTYDMETVDITLTEAMSMLLTSVGWMSAGIAVQITILPWQIFTITFIFYVYWSLVLHSRKSAVDLQRLDAVSRSPVQAKLSEVIEGAPTIRSFHRSHYFARTFRSSLDANTTSMMNFMAAQRWLAVRIQLVGATGVFTSVCVVVSFNEQLRLPAGLAAMLIIWSSNMTISLGFMVQAISESEAAITSVERLSAMSTIPQERTPPVGTTPDPSWPTSGALTFHNVTMRYREGLPLALTGLSFSLRSGQRCGIVGRTGAGKSSIALALFRLVEIEPSGSITLDGTNLATLSLADLRGRPNGLCIIPQDPILFAGSLRECLDPFGEKSDTEVYEALRAVRIGNACERTMEEVLLDRVEEGGSNYSVGERQLVCLARAILATPKVLVLDEATASVDSETDAFIQHMLRTRFEGTTLLTVAHRLHTIIDYDVILVLQDGKAAEFGTPRELLEGNGNGTKDGNGGTGGLFSDLIDATGSKTSAALRAKACGVQQTT